MAFQKPQGSQLDIVSVASEIEGNPTAIAAIASGVTSSPGAVAILDGSYVRRDADNAPNATAAGQVLILSGSPHEWENRLLLESDISDLGTTILLNSDIGSTVQAWDGDLDALAAIPHAGGEVIYSAGPVWASAPPGGASGVQAWDADLDTISGLTPVTNWPLIGDAGSPSGWTTRALVESDISNLGATIVLDTDIGSTVQAWDGNLDTFAAIAPTAGDVLYATGSPGDWAAAPPGGTSGVQAWDADLDTVAGLSHSGGEVIYSNGGTWAAAGPGGVSGVQAWDADLDTFAALTPVAGWALIGSTASPSTWENRALVEADISDLQSYLLPADIGSTVQAWDADLDTIAALTPVAGWFLVGDGSPAGWTSRALVEADINDLGTTIVLDTDIGSTVQAWDGDLDTLAGLSHSGGEVVYSNGGTWAAAGPGGVSGVQAWDADLDTISGLTKAPSWVIVADGSPVDWTSRKLATSDLSDATSVVTAAGYSVDLGPSGTAARALATGSPLSPIYTNATGKPIMLLIRVSGVTTPSAVEVDGTPVSSFSASSDTLEVTHSVVVPDGSTYSLVGSGAILTWYEVQ